MKDKYAKPWNSLFEAEKRKKYYRPLGQPAPQDLKIYKKVVQKHIKNIKSPKVLILGATPELRDLLYKLKCQVYLCDISKQVIQALTRLRKYKSPEKIIVSDWCDIKTKEKFDIIVGDITFANLPSFKQYPQMAKSLKKNLIPNGIIVLRHQFWDSQWKRWPFKRVIQHYLSDKSKTLTEKSFMIAIHLMVDSYNPNTGRMSMVIVKEWLDENINLVPTRVRKTMDAFWGNYQKEWTTSTKDNFCQLTNNILYRKEYYQSFLTPFEDIMPIGVYQVK